MKYKQSTIHSKIDLPLWKVFYIESVYNIVHSHSLHIQHLLYNSWKTSENIFGTYTKIDSAITKVKHSNKRFSKRAKTFWIMVYWIHHTIYSYSVWHNTQYNTFYLCYSFALSTNINKSVEGFNIRITHFLLGLCNFCSRIW